MIEIIGATKIFDNGKAKIQAIKDVSLKINKGEIHGIIGYSGAGKSTLIRCINLLERPTQGKILFKGEDLTSLRERELRDRRKKMGMIFQHFNLFNSRNVYKNVAYPLKGARLSREEERERVLELLELVGLEDRIKAYPSELSGGQKQRVAIARALANNPEVLLCDEATSALDPKTTDSILELLRELKNKLNLTIVLITHEMAVIKKICDKVSVMEDGQIIEEGEVTQIFTRPIHETTREFVDTITNRSRIYEILNGKENIFNIGAGDVLARVVYMGDSTAEALLSKGSRRYGIDASILYGNIEVLGDTPTGEMIILLSGEDENIRGFIDYFRGKGLIVEVLDHGAGTSEVHTQCC
ncbi:MAG: ATP-binding cassette domain-containing protein [Tissierellia bacterium]|nr:ATP-binding cassette domain-containing protein [Tissierellia bacterium]